MDGDYSDWSERFRNPFEEQDRPSWETARARLAVGDQVAGTVITKAPFGAWIDIGIGFPALLEIILIEGLSPEMYQADQWCPVGSQVVATIAGFDDEGLQLRLTQLTEGTTA